MNELDRALKHAKHTERTKVLGSKETFLACVVGQVKDLVIYQREVDKGKLTAAES